jgi:hypothetical protein
MAVYEMFIAAHNFGPGRAQEGDIIAVREPIGFIGNKEQADFLLLVVETEIPAEDLMETGSRRKRERFLPLQALASKGLQLNLDRVRDPQDKYQPGIDPDPVTGAFRRSPTPVNLDDIIGRRS